MVRISGHHKKHFVPCTGIQNCEGLFVDETNDLLLWTDDGRNRITIAKLSNTTVSINASYTGWGKSYDGLEFPYEFFVRSHKELRLALETLT